MEEFWELVPGDYLYEVSENNAYATSLRGGHHSND